MNGVINLKKLDNSKNKNKKFSRYERTFEIMAIIAKVGVVVFAGVVAPNAAGQIIKFLNWLDEAKEREQVRKSLLSLEKRRFIKIWYKDGEGKMSLTKEGKIYFTSLEAKKIKLPKGKWDGKWRMVTFDIPETLKVNRKKFSDNLRFIGMLNLDKSVFVYPHECKEQVIKIAELYEIKRYIRYITAISIEPPHKLFINFPYTRNHLTRR